MQECPKCGTEMKLVPAGISKKGNAYAAFHSCPKCKHTQNTGEVKSGFRSTPPQVKDSFNPNKDQNRAWGKSKNRQIAIQGIVQALIASGVYNERLNTTDHSGLIKTAEVIRHQIEEFADKQVGFNRAADEMSPSFDEGITVEDIPF